MFPGVGEEAEVRQIGVAELSSFVAELSAAVDDAGRVEKIALLQSLKCMCAAAQAELTDALTESQKAEARERNLDPAGVIRSVAAQVGLARRESPSRGRRAVGLAHGLTHDMPNTLSAMRAGQLSEYRASVIAAEFALLSADDRRRGDQLIADRLTELSDRQAQSAAAGIAAKLDVEAILNKHKQAVRERRVTMRPTSDSMVRLCALLPMVEGISAWAALHRYAEHQFGDDRTKNQLMADELVNRITGRSAPVATENSSRTATSRPGTEAGEDHAGHADEPIDDPVATVRAAYEKCKAAERNKKAAPDHPGEAAAGSAKSNGNGDGPSVDAALPDRSDKPRETTRPTNSRRPERPAKPTPNPGVDAYGIPYGQGAGLSIQLVMTDRTLLDGDDEPAHLTGFGPIPAALARQLIYNAADATTKTWIRRLYTDPTGQQLISQDSTQRIFPDAMAKFLLTRDQICRTPFCDAPIRHNDHVRPSKLGGPTSLANGQGLCENCNYTKEAGSWTSQPQQDGSIQINTPTGQHHTSTPPPPPRSGSWQQPASKIEIRFVDALWEYEPA